MPSKPTPPEPDDPDVGDANFLFGDESPRKAANPRRGVPIAPSDGYDLADPGDDEDDEPVPVPRAPVLPAAAPRPKSRPKVEAPAREASVDEVWTRGGEWGPTLILLGGVGLAVLVVFYMLMSAGLWGPAFLFALLGGAVWVVLSYPIVITLERPVRITPEQAAKDYYAALSHHFPHYRRMWLLLSDDGKQAAEFDSFPAFRAYWKLRLAQLRGKSVKASTPLAFEVADFKAEKSAGKTAVDGKYTVIVRPRGESATPVDSVRIESGFAKGPDNMWYLNSGTLPGRL